MSDESLEGLRADEAARLRAELELVHELAAKERERLGAELEEQRAETRSARGELEDTRAERDRTIAALREELRGAHQALRDDHRSAPPAPELSTDVEALLAELEGLVP